MLRAEGSSSDLDAAKRPVLTSSPTPQLDFAAAERLC